MCSGRAGDRRPPPPFIPVSRRCSSSSALAQLRLAPMQWHQKLGAMFSHRYTLVAQDEDYNVYSKVRLKVVCLAFGWRGLYGVGL